MTHESINRRLLVFGLLLMLAACASPIPKAEITPVYAGDVPPALSVASIDHRSFILSNDKEEWFEGIFHGVYGIPSSLKRPGPKSGQPFAVYLSSMLSEALDSAGSNVNTLTIPKGTSLEKAIELLSVQERRPALVLLIRQSRYVVKWSSNAEYNFNFDVIVVDTSGNVLLDKNFSRFDTSIPLSDKYTIFDMYAAIYKQTLDEILRDPDVVGALSGAAGV
jgi:hypothetical protein